MEEGYSVRSDLNLLDKNTTLIHHYSLLVFKTAGVEGKFELTPDILGHFLTVICSTTKENLEITIDGEKTTVGRLFNKCGGFDCVAALDPSFSCEEHQNCGALHIAEQILKDRVTAGFISEDHILQAINGILPKDPVLIMLWDVNLQEMARARGELKQKLELALNSSDLKRLPKEIAELNLQHALELLKIAEKN
ncbi:MAG: hypothetical protein ABID61_04715 [Candidatus Micrarchaeota archaeon]